MHPARADTLRLATTAYARGDYVRAVNVLTPLALRGNSRAQAFLGFMYENGFGAPQAYDAAADLYIRAAIKGNPFAQCMLGLMYDKGHGVPQDFILAYKWLNLAAARAAKTDREVSPAASQRRSVQDVPRSNRRRTASRAGVGARGSHRERRSMSARCAHRRQRDNGRVDNRHDDKLAAA